MLRRGLRHKLLHKLKTDIIFIDMKTGDINLKMIDKSKKVRLTTNYEFN